MFKESNKVGYLRSCTLGSLLILHRKGEYSVMIVFIGGAREIKELPTIVKQKLSSIIDKEFSVVVGDAYGVDSEVQRFFYYSKYDKVKVFITNGKTRNNLGNWETEDISVPRDINKSEYYMQKDIAMSKVADLGYMVWNGKSRGTLNNIINMATANKQTVVYFAPTDTHILIQRLEDLERLLEDCPIETLHTYKRLRGKNNE